MQWYRGGFKHRVAWRIGMIDMGEMGFAEERPFEPGEMS